MSLQYMILGLLKYGAVSGYDLNKAFQASVQHFWNTEQSQIYRALYKLHEAGWVAMEPVVQEDLPNKKLYSLTDAGREALHQWLATPQSLASVHEAWIGQLFFGAELSRAELEYLLRARITELQELVRVFEQELPANGAHYAALYNAQQDLPYWGLTIDYGLQKARFDRQWAETALRNLDQLPGDTPEES